MLRFSASLIAMTAGLALSGMAEANGGRGTNGSGRGTSNVRSISSMGSKSMSSKNWNSSNSHSNYNMKNGTKFDHGYFYKGKYQDHWSHYCWNSSYGCYLYYDPC